MKMRGSIVCTVIFCLAYVTAAPTAEEGKTEFKSYKFDKGDVIHSIFPVLKDQTVFAVCEGSEADKKCKVYVESPNQDKDTVESCDLNLTYSGRSIENLVLYNAGNSKAIFIVRVGNDKLKLISVNLKGCQIKENTVEVIKGDTPSYNPLSALVYVLPHETNYELFLHKSKDCVDGVCKITYDYDGNVVKAATKVPAVFLGSDKIEYANNNYIIAKNQGGSVKIYLIKDGEDPKDIPSIASLESRHYYIAMSADENKVAFCSHGDGKVLCQQIHVDGEPRAINSEIPFNFQSTTFHSLEVLNLEKGLLQLAVGAKNVVNVAHFDETGKQGKSVHIDPKCNENYALVPKFYKNTNGQYCVNSLCMAAIDATDRSQFSINNRCFNNSELF